MWGPSHAAPHPTRNTGQHTRGVQGLVKRFFNEKEVTSTLVMDALFSGCKQLEEMSRAAETKKVPARSPGPGTSLHAAIL